MQRKRFLVTGHARSGTAYMAVLLQSMGIVVGFEKMGPEGIVAGHFAVPDYPTRYDKSMRKDFTFAHIIQLVRHPLKVLASFHFTEPEAVPDRHKKWIEIPEDAERLEACVWSIVRWNELIAKQQPDVVLQVERCPGDLYSWFASNGWKFDTNPPETGVNSRPHKVLTAEGVRKQISEDAWEAFADHSVKYGYDLYE